MSEIIKNKNFAYETYICENQRYKYQQKAYTVVILAMVQAY